MNESMDELSIEINSSVGDSTKKIQDLITSLDSLETSLKNVVKQSENLSVLKNNIGNVKTSSSSSRVSKIKTFKSESSQLSDLGVDLNKYKMTNSVKTTNSELIKYKNNLGQVVTITRKFKDSLDGTEKELADVKVRLSQTHKEMKQGHSLWRALTKGASGFIVSAKLVIGTIKDLSTRLADTVTKASQYEEALNLFTVTMGDNKDRAMTFVDRFSDALYLDPKNVMQYMGSFNSLIEGLGVGSENALLMSENMTQLVYDLASFKNLSFQTAYEKLMSGISGELEPLRNVGVALSQNTLQELANSLGIKQRVAEMNEAQKAQLRYIQIMKASTEWQTDMGRTLLQPANAVRVMKEQFSLLAQAIGRVFIPVVMKLMPYVVALTQILTDFANTVAEFFGYKFPENNNSAMGKLETQIGDIGDEAGKTTKKLNTMLAPFDELNVVQNKTEGSGSGALGSIGGELDTVLPFYDALAKLDENFGKSVDSAKEKLQGILEIVGMIGAGLLTWKVSSWITGLSMPIAGGILGENVITKGGQLLNTLKVFGTIALTLTAGAVLIKAGKALKDLIDLDPTLEEINDYFSHIGTDGEGYIPIIGDLVSFGQNLGKNAHNLFGNSFYDFGVFMKESIISGLGEVASLLGLNDEPITTSKGSSGSSHGGAGKEFKKSLTQNIQESVGIFKSGFDKMNNVVKQGDEQLSNTINSDFSTINSDINTAMNINKNIANNTLDKITTSVFDFFAEINGASKTSYNQQHLDLTNALNNQTMTLSSKLPGIVTSWKNLALNSKNSFKQGMTGIGTDTQNVISSDLNKITSQKSWLNNTISAFKTIGVTLGNSLSNSININSNTVASNIQRGLKGISFVDKVLGVTKQLFQDIQIKGYATGGYPESGQFFMARENGIPEMVGRIGSKTAVANNDQITTAITNAIIQGLSGYGNNNTPVTVYIGNDKIYEGYGQHVDSENDRYGTNVVHV